MPNLHQKKLEELKNKKLEMKNKQKKLKEEKMHKQYTLARNNFIKDKALKDNIEFRKSDILRKKRCEINLMKLSNTVSLILIIVYKRIQKE